MSLQPLDVHTLAKSIYSLKEYPKVIEEREEGSASIFWSNPFPRMRVVTVEGREEEKEEGNSVLGEVEMGSLKESRKVTERVLAGMEEVS